MRQLTSDKARVAVIGGGFCGLAAAYELTRHGMQAVVFEREPELGGLAGSFNANGTRLEKFYHHWFRSDEHLIGLVKALGYDDRVTFRSTRTGMYVANSLFMLSSPLDLLRFTPLSILDRLRLGILVLYARRIRNWRRLESLTAEEWLRRICGNKVFEVVWEPLLRGKFGDFASDISAVWFWNKLKLRGGSRSKAGGEQLAYYRGGFAQLVDDIAAAITATGSQVHTGAAVEALAIESDRITGIVVNGALVPVDAAIATTPLPIFADLVSPHACVSPEYVARLRRIRYLANVCLVLQLDRSLSDTYWLNVNDPGFPFVGVIEHTNFEPSANYGNRHIVYLSKYLPESSPMFSMDAQRLVEFAIPHLRRMFPAFRVEWILEAHVWRAQYSQPIIERQYSTFLPSEETPVKGLFLATMAQIYPEDRGTNYAIRQGRQTARSLVAGLGLSGH